MQPEVPGVLGGAEGGWEGSGCPPALTLFPAFTGTDEKLLAHITEEGKTLMAAADSVITKVAWDLLSGAVLVGQLELVLNHQGQFLDIWELSESSAEGGGRGAEVPVGPLRVGFVLSAWGASSCH